MRTSKQSIFIRSCFVIFVVYILLSTLWNAATGTNFWKPWEMAISAVFSVLLFGGIAWLISNVGMALLFGRKAEYRAYRNSGGDPFFDSLPRIFNPDSRTVRESGQEEPRSNFVPPANWKFQCPQCGSRVEKRIDVCWYCNYGADNDNTAYLQRYGNVKPPELTEEQWQRVLRGEPVNKNERCVGGSCSQPEINDDGYDGWLPVDERPNPRG